MAQEIQVDVKEIEEVLQEILKDSVPPVARCRLLSSGFSPAHALDIKDDIAGQKACLGCGNCIDICPVLSREPRRREKTSQRTSMALENLVGEDCDRCYACCLYCPQVDTTIKRYIVNGKVIEIMEQIRAKLEADRDSDLTPFLEEKEHGF